MDLYVTNNRQWSFALWYYCARLSGPMLQYESWIRVIFVNRENREASLSSYPKMSLESRATPFCRSHFY
jgi:hypothetical protein